ncbi:MAG: hypothetical protein KAS74_08015 [Methanosarcinales archaeon]|nr:hypothetical protein [Methanosarcinales archaeon]
MKLEKRSRRYRFYRQLLSLIAFFLLCYALLLCLSVPTVFARYSSYDFMLLGHPVHAKLLCTAAIALVLAVVFSFLIRKKQVNIIKVIESRYPVLKERLPTAYDNTGIHNPIVDDLSLSVTGDISSVRWSKIISKNGLIMLVMISVVMAGVVSFVSSPDAPRLMTPEQIESAIMPADEDEREAAADEARYQQMLSELGYEAGSGESEIAQIYGKPSVAVIEGTSIELMMFSDAGVGQSARRTEIDQVNFISGTVYAATPVSSETYIDKLPEENRDLIKAYFMEMAEAGQ